MGDAGVGWIAAIIHRRDCGLACQAARVALGLGSSISRQRTNCRETG